MIDVRSIGPCHSSQSLSLAEGKTSASPLFSNLRMIRPNGTASGAPLRSWRLRQTFSAMDIVRTGPDCFYVSVCEDILRKRRAERAERHAKKRNCFTGIHHENSLFRRRRSVFSGCCFRLKSLPQSNEARIINGQSPE